MEKLLVPQDLQVRIERICNPFKARVYVRPDDLHASLVELVKSAILFGKDSKEVE